MAQKFYGYYDTISGSILTTLCFKLAFCQNTKVVDNWIFFPTTLCRAKSELRFMRYDQNTGLIFWNLLKQNFHLSGLDSAYLRTE